MRGTGNWSCRPYHPALYDGSDIYICRIAPGADRIEAEWLYEYGGEHDPVLRLRKRGGTGFTEIPVAGTSHMITGLEPDTDYEFMLTDGEHFSRLRLARTGKPVGVVINYLHPDDDAYGFSGHTLGSPSLLKLPSGALLAGMDLYSNGYPQNLELIFRSDDGGESWHYVSELMPCFWGKLFYHRGALYIIGCSTEYGDLLIGRSDDEGVTWKAPTPIFRGSCNSFFPGFANCPTPVVYANGRIWKGIDYGCRRAYDAKDPVPHAPAVISAPEDADLLDPAVWTLSHPAVYNPDWEGTSKGTSQGCLESNAVIAPDGSLYIIPRYHTNGCTPEYGRLLIYKADLSDPEKEISFLRAVDFNGNTSKFEIIRDEVSGYYIAVVNGLDERNRGYLFSRNLVMLYRSRDLVNWEFCANLIDLVGRKGEGSQNPSLVPDGDDLLMTMRTAINDPIGPMFANYATFHRIKNIRKLMGVTE